MYVRDMQGRGRGRRAGGAAAGPRLSAALDALDLAQVPGDQVVEVLRAQARQCAHEQARLWATLVEVGLADPVDDPAGPTSCDGRTARSGTVADWAPGEIAAALTWTSRTAERELDLAQVVVRALPEVFAALWAGEIDRGKAVVFAGHLDPAHGVTPEQTGVICARLLPIAPRLTTAQLRGRLWRAVLAIDPGWARRRYTRAVRARAVTAVLADDGTVTITGSGLPADEAAVACARVDRLAEAAKRAGHPGRAGQIAADVYLGLLDGRFHGLSEEQIIAALLRDCEDRPDDTHRRPAPGDAARDGDVDDDNDADDTAATSGSDDALGACTNVPPIDNPATDESAKVGPAAGHARRRETTADRRRDPGRLGHAARARRAARRDPRARTRAARGRPSLVTRQQRGAEWRFAVTDPDGHLLLAGVTRRRPRCTPVAEPTVGRCSGGIVELQIGADSAHRARRADRRPGRRPRRAAVDHSVGHRDRRHRRPVRRPARGARRPRRPPLDRFPGPALARHVQVRDRTCSAPGLSPPGAPLRPGPHARPRPRWSHGAGQPRCPAVIATIRSSTVADGGSPSPRRACSSGRARCGQVYRTRGEPIMPPLPDPRPRPPEPDNDHSGRMWIEGPIMRLPDPPSPDDARPPPVSADPDEPAPF